LLTIVTVVKNLKKETINEFYIEKVTF